MAECSCECTPTGLRRCYLPEQPTPVPLYLGTDPQTVPNMTGTGGGGATLVSDTVVNGRIRKEYEFAPGWGGIPDLSGRMTLWSTGANNAGAFQAVSTGTSIGGPRCGTMVLDFSRRIPIGNFPLVDFDATPSIHNGEMIARIDPPFTRVLATGGGPVVWNPGAITATNPNNLVADASWNNNPKQGGNMPNCLGGKWDYAEPNTGPVSSSTQNNNGALFFGWREVQQMSWSIELPSGLGVGFPWVTVLPESPYRRATLQRCPTHTPQTEWIDSSTGVALTAAQVDSLTDCQDI